MSHRLLSSLLISVVVLSCLTATVRGQSAGPENLLPTPTGRFSIGRITIHLEDRTRIEPFSSEHRYREVMADVWYPATSSKGQPATYIDLARFEAALGTTGTQNFFGNAYIPIKVGRVRTHAIEGAAFATSLKHCPVLIFSPGMGTVTQIYTAQFEDLASDGYIVVALTPPYDAGLTLFLDGRNVVMDTASRPPQGSPEEEQIAYERKRIEWWAKDIRFAIDELARIDKEKSPAVPFASHLDLGHIAAFGHSVGGEAAARACQLDARLQVCLDQDGVQRFAPFHLDEAGWGMNQPFLLFTRSPDTSPFTEKELTSMEMTLAQAQAFAANLQAAQENALRHTGGGSYRVFLHREGTTHMSFSDLPVLQATSPMEVEARTKTLEVILEYDRSFFDKYLRGHPAPLLDHPKARHIVDAVQWFEPGIMPKKK